MFMNRQPFVKFVRLIHHQTFALYGSQDKGLAFLCLNKTCTVHIHVTY